MLFTNFSSDLFDDFKSKLHDVAEQFKSQGIVFLLGDIEASKQAFQVSNLYSFLAYILKIFRYVDHFIDFNEQFFGLQDDQVPLIIIQTTDGQKYLKPNVKPDHIVSWVKDFKVALASSFSGSFYSIF